MNQKANSIRHHKRWTHFVVLVAVMFSSCIKQEFRNDNVYQNDNQTIAGRTTDNIAYREGTTTVLGESKKNPYTVKNMSSAWLDLQSRGIITNVRTNVHTSHYYIKFKPKTEEEYERLIADSSVTFSDIPLESEIIQNGDYYHDPSLPDTVPTYQYVAVKVNYQFPEGIEYEILDNLCIPEVDPVFNYENGGTEDCFVDKLLNQAYLQTRNDEEIIDVSNCEQSTAARRYTPV